MPSGLDAMLSGRIVRSAPQRVTDTDVHLPYAFEYRFNIFRVVAGNSSCSEEIPFELRSFRQDIIRDLLFCFCRHDSKMPLLRPFARRVVRTHHRNNALVWLMAQANELQLKAFVSIVKGDGELLI